MEEFPSTQLWLKVLLPIQESMKAVELAFFQWVGSGGECVVLLLLQEGQHVYATICCQMHASLSSFQTLMLAAIATKVLIHIVRIDNHAVQVKTCLSWRVGCHADVSNPFGDDLVHLIKDPVSQTFNGHVVVKMKSSAQASWVMKDLNDMLFFVSTGPRPLQASLALAGK